MSIDIIEQVRQPEYTGENRCEPCTVLNLIIAGLLGSALARKSKAGGVFLFAVSVGLIYLRGYLVPGTPALTKQYLPPEVLRWFGKEPAGVGESQVGAIDVSTEETAADGTEVDLTDTSANQQNGETPSDDTSETVEPDEYFIQQGLVEPCESIDDLCLTEDFETAWLDEIDRVDGTDVTGVDIAEVFGLDTDEDALEIEQYDDARILKREGRHIGKWPSQAALVADVTAARVLQSWDDNWASHDPSQQSQILSGLRLFLETCPTSGGAVSFGQETVESCCTSMDVVAVTCEDTGERLFEQPVSDIVS